MSTANFYRDLEPFIDSKELLNSKFYVPVPADWILFLTDIRGSTKAIERGHYKDVNMIGACSIIAAKNATGDFDFPFVFGGDGASMAVPPQFSTQVTQALSFVRKKARDDFDLELRIARIPMSEISPESGQVRVAKYQISPGNFISMFAGGGLLAAEALMKSNPELLVPNSELAIGSVDGLECRWNPISATRDGILTLIVKAENSNVIVDLMNSIANKVQDPKPVKRVNISISWPPKYLWEESTMKFAFLPLRFLHFIFWNFLTFIFWILFSVFKNQKAGKVEEFLQGLSKNSDYIKFDDHFRMILDVSFEEKEFILQLLESLRKQKSLVYGTHFSSQALMTCFIQTREKHIHFIDGGDGGYALAAKEMKSQMSAKM